MFSNIVQIHAIHSEHVVRSK